MDNYGTKLAEAFAQKVVSLYYQQAVAPSITNTDYEGEVKNKASKLNILTFGKLGLKDYTGAALSADDPQESNGTLTTDQQKAYYFKLQSLDKFHSYIKNPEGGLLAQCGSTLKETIDSYILGFYTDVAAGQRIGTDYTTGTVAVTATTGAVVGTGTTFTAAMVGKPFKATGHSKWYRVKTFTDTTHITIENDEDDVTSYYDGGAITAGASYTIQAISPVALTKSTLFAQIVKLSTLLNKAKVPKSDRWLVVPADVAGILTQCPELTPAVPTAYEDVVKKGLLGTIQGFTVYENEQIAGDNTNGYHVLAGHKSAITFASAFTESGVEDLIGDFGKAYKGLDIYGAKVVDERRKALAELFCTVS